MPAGNDVPGSRNLSFSTKATETGLNQPSICSKSNKFVSFYTFLCGWLSKHFIKIFKILKIPAINFHSMKILP